MTVFIAQDLDLTVHFMYNEQPDNPFSSPAMITCTVSDYYGHVSCMQYTYAVRMNRNNLFFPNEFLPICSFRVSSWLSGQM